MATPDHSRDEAAVRALEAAYDVAWENGDVEALVSCLAEDAVIVNPLGKVARGHAEIRRMLGQFLAGPAKGSRHRSLILRVEFITVDVAIVDGEAVVEDLPAKTGTAAATLAHGFTDVVVRRDGNWKVAHVRAYAPVSGTMLGSENETV